MENNQVHPLFQEIVNKLQTPLLQSAERKLENALVEITNVLGVVNFSSHKQMREAIEGAMELAESALAEYKVSR